MRYSFDSMIQSRSVLDIIESLVYYSFIQSLIILLFSSDNGRYQRVILFARNNAVTNEIVYCSVMFFLLYIIMKHKDEESDLSPTYTN